MNVFDGNARHVLHWVWFHGSSKPTRVQTFGSSRGSCGGPIHVCGTSSGSISTAWRSILLGRWGFLPMRSGMPPLIHGAIAVHRRSRGRVRVFLSPSATAPVAREGGDGLGSGNATRHKHTQGRATKEGR